MPRRALLSVAFLVGAALLPGCVQRTIKVTSQPEGALVWLNDVEVGRTPLEVDFTYYGEYDVRLRREGFEAVTTSRSTPIPLYERPGIDLIAAALPTRIESVVEWHFDLQPVAEAADRAAAEQDLVERARELKGNVDPGPAPEQSPGR